MVDPILIGAVAFGLWAVLGRDSQTSTSPSSPDWRDYETVGTSPDNIEVIVQGNFQYDIPKTDDWQWRVVEKVGSQTTPVAGKSQLEAFEQFGRNASTEAIDPNKWGVPFEVAQAQAEQRLISISGVQGGAVGVVETRTVVTELGVEEGQAVGEVEVLEEFPDASTGSLVGFDLGGQTVIENESGSLFLGGGVTQ